MQALLFLLVAPALAAATRFSNPRFEQREDDSGSSFPHDGVFRQAFKVVLLQGVASKVEMLHVAIQDHPEIARKAVKAMYPIIVEMADRNGNAKLDTQDLEAIHPEILEYYKEHVQGKFVDYPMQPDLQKFLKIDGNGDGDVSESELERLIVDETDSANWHMAVQFFVQSFDTEPQFQGYLSPSEKEAAVASLMGRFMNLGSEMERVMEQPEEPLPAVGTAEDENALPPIPDADLQPQSAAAKFLQLRKATLQMPVDFRKVSFPWDTN